jgi:glucose/arabinose dehydrogenase
LTPRPVRRLALALVATAGALIASLAGVAASAGAGGGERLDLRRVAGFDAPVFIEDAPGRKKLLFVVEQRGTIAVVRSGRKLAKPFLDLRDRVQTSYEEGLLSVAFDPAYARNRRFFVYYVNRDSDIQVDSFKRKRRSPTRANARSRRTLLVIPHPGQTNHNGGQLQFGDDGMLYIGTGDGGGSGDPGENAQNPDSLLGKLLRIDPRRKRGYDSPASNPFAGGPGADEVYSLGLRNPFRFSFDRGGDGLVIGDVGQHAWEEIDFVSAADARGANFGWDNLEGNHFFEAPGTEPPNYRAPIHEYTGGTSVIAGYVVRDPRLGSLAGRLLYADLSGDQIRSLDPYAAQPSPTDAGTGLPIRQPSSFGEGAGGRIYVASLADNAVYRIVAR